MKQNDISDSSRERITRLRQRVLDATPEVEMERALIVTDFYRKHEALPVALQRSGSMKDVFQKLQVVIRDDELIVGAEGNALCSVQVFPEYSVHVLEQDIDTLGMRPDYNRFTISEENKRIFNDEILPYWKGRTTYDLVMELIPDEAVLANKAGIILFGSGTHQGIGHILPDYSSIILRGANAIYEEILERSQALDLSDPDNMEKYIWYRAAAEALEGFSTWGLRHAREAERQAAKTNNEMRRKELLEIAQVCRQVPANPARTLYEALQAYWFAHMAVRLENTGIATSVGRFDQIFNPFYQHDLFSREIDEMRAEELIQCLWVKFNESNLLQSTQGSEPYVSRQALTIGGVDEDGFDATNDMTYLALRAQEAVALHQPSVSLRCHAGMPENLLREALRVLRGGGGIPSLFNDDIHIYSLMNRGASLVDARNYGVVGCVEVAPANNSWPNCSAGKFNLLKCLTLALNNGVDPATGRQLGPATGEPVQFTGFDELVAAYRAQVAYFVALEVQSENAIEIAHKYRAPSPFTSALINGCIANGKDAIMGGAKYNWVAPQATGQANVGDALAAVKKLVYEEKCISMQELLWAMENNFVEDEDLRRMLLAAPKYGNDDDYVDLLVRDALKAYTDEVARYKNARGGSYHAGSFPGLSFITFGKALGATPDGRKAGEALSTGVTPVNGRDVNGLTSVVNSAGKLDYFSASNGTVLTLWLHPTLLDTERGIGNTAALVRSYFEIKGQEIQFNIVSAETLKEAMEKPEQYRSLIVRVTGWSSFFTGLTREVQDEIVERTLFHEKER